MKIEDFKKDYHGPKKLKLKKETTYFFLGNNFCHSGPNRHSDCTYDGMERSAGHYKIALLTKVYVDA